MNKNQNHNQTVDGVLITELSKDLDALIQQVLLLIRDIHDNKIEFTKFQSELEHLIENVKEISSIVWGANTQESILTRLALVESVIQDIKNDVERLTDNGVDIKNDISVINEKILQLFDKFTEIIPVIKAKTAKKNIYNTKTSKWKLYVTIIGGAVTIISAIIALLVQLKII